MVVAIIAIVTVTVLGILAASGYRLFPLFLGATNVTLPFSPNNLRTREVILAITAMIEKSVIRSMARLVASAFTLSTGGESTLYAPFHLSQDDVARYHAAIGLKDRTTTSIDSSHLLLFLSAVTEPAMLLLLANRSCPINPLGAVNVRNRFELLQPDLCDLSSFKHSNRAALIAKAHNEPRPVKRGVEYDLEVSILIPDAAGNGAVVPVFRQVFTMLEFRKSNVQSNEVTSGRPSTIETSGQSSKSITQFQFGRNDPLKWAALCKDYNFIHLSGFAAKLLGLPGKLAHGNHVVAKAIQTLLDTSSIQSLGSGTTWMEVQFKRPVVVPAKLGIEMDSAGTPACGFAITNSERICVTVEYGSL
ncbi:hypothetical protein BKA66DRAFT_572269 [Pyrenochaeta sp. MPI-SDFR-AT-0127]|nr:hypothetical protein BKA66DRAFT_572269 [Pyrenochaeta sp. MPI-SDFR-AT-0127]